MNNKIYILFMLIKYKKCMISLYNHGLCPSSSLKFCCNLNIHETIYKKKNLPYYVLRPIKQPGSKNAYPDYILQVVYIWDHKYPFHAIKYYNEILHCVRFRLPSNRRSRNAPEAVQDIKYYENHICAFVTHWIIRRVSIAVCIIKLNKFVIKTIMYGIFSNSTTEKVHGQYFLNVSWIIMFSHETSCICVLRNRPKANNQICCVYFQSNNVFNFKIKIVCMFCVILLILFPCELGQPE